MGDKMSNGINITKKILVSLLWIAAGVVSAAGGKPLVLVPVIAYLAYLWALDGRWLIY